MWEYISKVIVAERMLPRRPVRVRRTRTDQQIGAEVLIGWIQLLLFTFFVLLYTFAPKTSEETGFQPVPSALGLYLAFTAIRLWLAFERMGEVTVRGRATPTTVYAMRDLPMPAASVKLGRAEA
ncbi:MAG: hypothetical protein IIB63_08260 [Proteobacteria bacterium]|nr:hypothetical protein [Pseudomonadota bacterium]